jgi:hypothetical protein
MNQPIFPVSYMKKPIIEKMHIIFLRKFLCLRIETGEICNIFKGMLEKDPKNRITSSVVVNRLTEIILKVIRQTFS